MLKATLIVTTAAAIALASFGLSPAAAAPATGPAITKQTVADEFSGARKRRHSGNAFPVAAFGALVGTMLPTMLLSGFIFPIESMPWPLRAVSVVVPARWFVLLARSIMLKGVGLAYLWRPSLVLLAMALLLLTASTRAFHERLD